MTPADRAYGEVVRVGGGVALGDSAAGGSSTVIDGLTKVSDGTGRRGPSPPDKSGGCRCTPPDGRRRVAGAEAAGSFREVMAIRGPWMVLDTAPPRGHTLRVV